jgi:hypothetical protein
MNEQQPEQEQAQQQKDRTGRYISTEHVYRYYQRPSEDDIELGKQKVNMVLMEFVGNACLDGREYCIRFGPFRVTDVAVTTDLYGVNSVSVSREVLITLKNPQEVREGELLTMGTNWVNYTVDRRPPYGEWLETADGWRLYKKQDTLIKELLATLSAKDGKVQNDQ